MPVYHLIVHYMDNIPYLKITHPDHRDQNIRCALGPNGMTHIKREGDGATPIGRFDLRQVYYRADKISKPKTALPCIPINPNDGWCDDPKDQNYNKAVALPYPASAESMWRNDHLYDICVILGHNDNPPIKGAGSAIFFHLAHDDYRPTEGCVAILEQDMRQILQFCSIGSCIEIDD